MQAVCSLSPTSIRVTVRERMRTGDANMESCWPLDFVTVAISKEADGTHVKIDCGEWGTCPIYLRCTPAGLSAHWDPAQLFPLLASPALCEVFAAHFLVGFEHPYATRTIFPEIQRLTAHARAYWHAGDASVRFEMPPSPDPLVPHRLKPGADVLGTFEASMMTSLRRYVHEEESIGALLSGGFDSSIVAAVAARVIGKPIRTYGLIMPGDRRDGQRMRRKELVERFGFEDEEFDTEKLVPLDPESVRIRELRVVPWEECYYEAFDSLLVRAVQRGDRTLATGNGGDELCMPHWTERPPSASQPVRAVPPFLNAKTVQTYRDTEMTVERAPRATIPTSALSASAASGPLFMRHGVWSLSPMCTPELVRLCRRLPLEWREGRKLWWSYLRDLGCSPCITHPKDPEDFGPLMELGLRRNADFICGLFRDSCLGDMGYLDVNCFLREYRAWCSGTRTAYDPAYFLFTSILELSVKSAAAHCGQLPGGAA